MSVKISLSGVKEIDQVLVAMPKELTHKTLGAAHAAAAKPLVDKAKLLAPEGETGNLVDSIGAVKTPFAKANVIGEVVAGPRRTRRLRGHHGHLVEFGTKSRRTKKGWFRGVMPKKPFMAPAFMQTHAMVVKQISVEVGRKMWLTMKRYIR